MKTIIAMNKRGTITLPKEMRRRLGLTDQATFIAESSKEGVLLRPSVTSPVESYSEERLKEFSKYNEEELRQYEL